MTIKEYIVTKIEKKDKAWPQVLDDAIENTFRDDAAAIELIRFYTDVKNTIWQHLAENFEQVILDTHNPIKKKVVVSRQNKTGNVLSTQLAGLEPSTSRDGPENISLADPLFSFYQAIIDAAFNCEQAQDIKNALDGFEAARFIAVLVAGQLVNTLKQNLTVLGVQECGALYARAAIRVIVEKQLGSRGKKDDYNALINLLIRARETNGGALQQFIDIMIKSAIVGNPYTRVVCKPKAHLHASYSSSKAFTKHGLPSAVFATRNVFLQSLKPDVNKPLLFSILQCLPVGGKKLQAQYFLTENAPLIATNVFFSKAAADCGDGEAQFNYGVDLFLQDNTPTGLNAVIKYWNLAAIQEVQEAKLNHELYLKLIQSSDFPDLEKISVRSKIVKQYTTKPFCDISDKGLYPKSARIVKRDRRDYRQERSIQILRHIATQLYCYCKASKIDAVEVQVMYYDRGLYVSANRIVAAHFLFSQIGNRSDFKAILTAPYQCGNDSKISISRRHAEKLKTRVYGQYNFASVMANNIKELLNSRALKTAILDISNLTSLNSFFKHQPNSIYIVTNRAQGLVRHAEEDLMDIFEALRRIYGKNVNEAIIYGKRRPCFSCHSRLDALQSEGDGNLPVTFNPRPGLFFEAAFYAQSTQASNATYQHLLSKPTIYKTSEDEGYNTLSDSDEEQNSYTRYKMHN